MLSLYRTGACQNLTDVLVIYGIHIAALQKIRWSGNGQLKVEKYIIYFSRMEERNRFGSGFAVHESLEPCIIEFNPVSERIAVLRVDTQPLNIVLVCTHQQKQGMGTSRMRSTSNWHTLMNNWQGI
ncbi:uncharacterized protein LOC103308977 [Acyrthosiphon pisum]|uniref:Uncharacterized protein n=1 Tax=Acyrthosiphon pisum TaxID=7029 RepID=A0A8R2F7L5_ACYPI|nr:uncharacterized protein LOC103308977 [Acyrthosiphon pisum]|eukprot:XP_008181591.1 PREDICTED: uncharacterized protein LOC103308977 [Acyrthosiphon pisum]